MVPDIEEHVVVKICNATGPESFDQNRIAQLLKAINEEIYGKTTDSLDVYRWAQEVALGLTDFEDVPDELKVSVRMRLINNYLLCSSVRVHRETNCDK